MITIIDYNTGNLGSIQNILKRIGVKSVVTSDKHIIESAEKIILPGVGAFDTGMKNLIELDLVDVLNFKVLKEKKPVLGICLGMQLMSEKSEEGRLRGLGWISGETRRFNFSDTRAFKSPHMGWNFVSIQKQSNLFSDMYEEARFYFVHSFYIAPAEKSDILTITNYENDFVSSVQKENIIGVQFHPEKSHKFGMKLLRNFNDHF